MEDIVPEYLSMGIDYDRIMDSCPVDLEPFIEGYKRKQEKQNHLMYIQGIYFRDALMSSLGNSQWFKGKGEAPFKYPEKPYALFSDEKISAEEEKKRDLEEFIAQEEIRRANWKMRKMREQEG